MATELLPYHHSAIPEGSDEIRLIRLVDPETVLIFHASLSDAPGYRALSYTWGYMTGDQALTVISDNGDALQTRVLKVTQNCLDAIRRLYEDDCFTPLWIDAICIDQTNNKERHHQVGLMSRIYSGANKVQIYLGPGNKNTSTALAWVNREHEFLDSGTPLLYFPYTDTAPPEVVSGLADILFRSWFTRLWVLQEVHFARYAEAFCGDDKVPWSVLRLLGQHYYDNQSDSNNSNQMKKGVIPPVLALGKGKSDKPLAYWIAETIHLKPTDERDSVYALLSLSTDVQSGELKLTPNYDIGLSDIKKLLLDTMRESIFKDVWSRHNMELTFVPLHNAYQLLKATLRIAIGAGLYMLEFDPFQSWLLMTLEHMDFTDKERLLLRGTYRFHTYIQRRRKNWGRSDQPQAPISGYQTYIPKEPQSLDYSSLVSAKSVQSTAISSNLKTFAYSRLTEASAGIVGAGLIDNNRSTIVSDIASWKNGEGVDIALSANGAHLAISMKGSPNVVIYRVQDPALFQVVGDHDRGVDMFRMSDSVRYVCLVYDKLTLSIWDTEDRRVIRTIITDAMITCVAFSEDEQSIVTGHMNGAFNKFGIFNEIGIYRANTSAEYHSPVTDVAFSPDGSTIASASANGDLIIQGPDHTKVSFIPTVAYGALCSLSYDMSGRFLLVAVRDGTLNWLDADGRIIETTQQKPGIRRVVCSRSESSPSTYGVEYFDGLVEIHETPDINLSIRRLMSI